MKVANRSAVLREIRQNGRISRADLAKNLQMSPTSMTRICNDLKELSLVQEMEGAAGSVGRRAVMLSQDPEACYGLGILLRTDFISIAITDYTWHTLRTVRKEQILSRDPEQAMLQILQTISEDRAENPDDHRRIHAVCISVPGMIDQKNGTILNSMLFENKTASVTNFLSEKLRLPVFLENDVNAALFEEYYGHKEIRHPEIALLSLSEDVRAAYMHDGHLQRGACGACGEISHSTLIPDGRPCLCGRRGCVDAYLSAQNIRRRAQELCGHPCRLAEIRTAYEGKESWAVRLADELADELAVLINQTLTIQNPGVVILAGRSIVQLPFLIDLALSRKERFNQYVLERTKIIPTRCRGNESVIGAAMIAVQNYEKLRLNSL